MRTKRLLAIGVCSLVLGAHGMTSLAAKDKAGDPPGNSGGVKAITHLPDPATFTERLQTVPDPFVSWEGTKVKPKDWPARAAQLRQIMEHYETGDMPSTDGITVSLAVTRPQSNYTGTSGAGAAQVTVFKDGVAAAHKITISFFLPDPANPLFPPPAKGYPVVLNTSTSVNGFWNLAAQYGIATVGIRVTDIDSGDNETGSYRGNNRAGVVNDIFNILARMPVAHRTLYSSGRTAYGNVPDGRWEPPYFDPNAPAGDPSAPSLMLSQAWGISRVIDALQQDNLKPADQRLINVDPLKSALSGISRLGKMSLVAGAFDSRIAVVNPVSSGSGGTVIDRFQSPAVNERQSLALAPSLGYEYELNKKYYYVKIKDKSVWDNTWAADAVLPAEALIDPAGRRDGGTTAASAFQSNEDYHDFVAGLKVADGALNPLGTGVNAATTTGIGHGDNIKPGFAVINFGIQTAGGAEQGHNQGTQNFADVRWGYGSWFNPRFREWAVPADLNDVDIIKRVNRGEYGYFITEPFDQHFLMAMIAPRALLLQDGYLSNNTSPEGTYFGYLAAREVYRFLGAPEKVGLNVHLINHANPLREMMELGEFMTAVFANQPLNPKFHVQPFPINDPRSLYDYQKLDWAAPGYKSLEKQVRQLRMTETDTPSASVYAGANKGPDEN